MILSGNFTEGNTESCFIEADYNQSFKYGQVVGGDVFLLHKIKEENRIISVLSDGLGSGIKANVLATLTSTMAVSFISNSTDITRTAETIMRTLPVCKVRKISYSTFTIIDIDSSGKARIIEYDNPRYIIIRNGRILKLDSELIKLAYNKNKENSLNYSEFSAQLGDRIIFFSDGVTQSGIGSRNMPQGWGNKNIEEYLLKIIKEKPGISARDLARSVVDHACMYDSYKAKDDVTCGVIYFRKPRKLLVLSGPPVSPLNDHKLADILSGYDGKKIICGGTTANIIARELQKTIHIDVNDHHSDLPPSSSMDGVDLITEGTITLGRVLEALDSGTSSTIPEYNVLKRVIDLLLNSDIIEFVVGTKINEAHMDPDMPIELGLRKNLIRNLARVLEEKHLKDTRITFV